MCVCVFFWPLPQLLSSYGPDVYLFLLRSVHDQVLQPGGSDSIGQKEQLKLNLLEKVTQAFVPKHTMASQLAQAVDGQPIRVNLVAQLAKAMKLSWEWELKMALGLSLCNNVDLCKQG